MKLVLASETPPRSNKYSTVATSRPNEEIMLNQHHSNNKFASNSALIAALQRRPHLIPASTSAKCLSSVALRNMSTFRITSSIIRQHSIRSNQEHFLLQVAIFNRVSVLTARQCSDTRRMSQGPVEGLAVTGLAGAGAKIADPRGSRLR
jgi:hypothetical protein